MKKYVYMVMAIVGLSALAGCKEDAYIEPLITETCGTYYYDRLDRPERIIHAGSVFSQYDYIGSEECRFSLSDKKFRGRTYLQINIGNMPTDMLVRVDGDVFWGYDPQTESEFKMYDFSKWPLEEGDSLIYRIYEINDNYEITGIADYSDVLKQSITERLDFLLGDEPKSRCTVINNFEDNIYEDSKIISIVAPYRSKTGKGIYSYMITCQFFAYDEWLDAEVLGGYEYVLNYGAYRGKGLFFKDKKMNSGRTWYAFLTKVPSL